MIDVEVLLLLDVVVLVTVALEDDEELVEVELAVVVVVKHWDAGTWLTRIPPFTRHRAFISLLDHATLVDKLPLGMYAQYGSRAYPKNPQAMCQ